MAFAAHPTMALPSNIESIITQYFHNNYSYDDILELLRIAHGVHICKRQFHRILRNLNLYRRRHKTPLNSVIVAVQHDLRGLGSSFGYILTN